MTQGNNWLDENFTGYNAVHGAGVPVPQRKVLNFGAGLTVGDDPTTGVTTITGTGSAPLYVSALVTTPPLNPSVQEFYIASAYSTPGDGGGGTFVWNPTDTRAADGGTIIAVTGIATGRWNRVYSGDLNPAWYGANYLGGDSTAAISACVAYGLLSGKDILFTAGSYAIEGNIVCTSAGNGVKIKGQGKLTTSITVVCDSSTDGFTWNPGSQYANGGGLQDIEIKSLNYTTSRDLVVVANMAYFTMRNVRLTGSGRYGLNKFANLADTYELVDINNSGADGILAGCTAGSPQGLATTGLFKKVYVHGSGGKGCKVLFQELNNRFEACIFESSGWLQNIPQTSTVGANPVPQTGPTTLNVVSTTGYPSSGWLYIEESHIANPIHYTGTTPTSFTGCSGGNTAAGTIIAAAGVWAIDPVNGQGIYVADGGADLVGCYFENNASNDEWYGDATQTGPSGHLYGTRINSSKAFHAGGAFTSTTQPTTFFDDHCVDSEYGAHEYFNGPPIGAGATNLWIGYQALVKILDYPRLWTDHSAWTTSELPAPQTPDGVSLLSVIDGNGLYNGFKFSFLSTSYAPGAISAGSYISTTISVPYAGGAAANPHYQPVIGDMVLVSSNQLPAGCFLSGTVTRAWTNTGSVAQIRVDIFNLTASPVTPSSGTLRIDIIKHTDTGTL